MAVETGTGAYFVKLCIFYTCRQEGPRYRQVQVEVTTPQGEVMKCRSYHLQNLELDLMMVVPPPSTSEPFC